MKFYHFSFLVIIVLISIKSTKEQFIETVRNVGNQFLSSVGLSRPYDNNNYEQSQNSPRVVHMHHDYIASCKPYFSYTTGLLGYGDTSGKLEIPNPDQMQNYIEAKMTLATRLTVKWFVQIFEYGESHHEWTCQYIYIIMFTLKLITSCCDFFLSYVQSNYYGEISLIKSSEDSAADIQNGNPLLLKIRFPVQNPLPRIHELFLNHQLLCSEPKGDLNVINSKIECFSMSCYFQKLDTSQISRSVSRSPQMVFQQVQLILINQHLL